MSYTTPNLADAVTLYTPEYLKLLATYESYNQQSLLIKGWAVTVSMGVLIAVYQLNIVMTRRRAAVFLASATVLPFYLTDALWKYLQQGYLPRLCQIESLVRKVSAGPGEMFQVLGKCAEIPSALGTIAPLQAISTWMLPQTGLQKVEAFVGAMINHTVYMPYLLILLAGVVLAAFFPPGVGTAQDSDTK